MPYATNTKQTMWKIAVSIRYIILLLNFASPFLFSFFFFALPHSINSPLIFISRIPFWWHSIECKACFRIALFLCHFFFFSFREWPTLVVLCVNWIYACTNGSVYFVAARHSVPGRIVHENRTATHNKYLHIYLENDNGSDYEFYCTSSVQFQLMCPI